MNQSENSKQYDLEDRTLQFAKDVREFIKKLPKTIGNHGDGVQLIRASGSVGANYIEANEAISKKDFIHRLKISRKEAKEARYWLRLVDTEERQALEDIRRKLIVEVTELMNIIAAIIRKVNS